MLNDRQRDTLNRLTWPVYGVTATTVDTVLTVNGVRVIVYASGKIDILSVDSDHDYALEAETSIRERFGHLILGHVKTFYR